MRIKTSYWEDTEDWQWKLYKFDMLILLNSIISFFGFAFSGNIYLALYFALWILISLLITTSYNRWAKERDRIKRFLHE